MAAKTGSELIDVVSGNLGNRSSGLIGGKSTDDAILDAINEGIRRICRKYKVFQAEKKLTLTLTTSAYEYAVPTSDAAGATIKIRTFLKLVGYKTGETTGYPILPMTAIKRDQLFPLTNTDRTGRPQYYSRFAEYLDFWPYPDATYIVNIKCYVYPTVFTTASVANEHFLGEEFDDVIENYATARCFLKLQQTDDYREWHAAYKDSLREVKSMLQDDPDWHPSDIVHDTEMGKHGDDLNDPTVRSFNS